MSADNTPTVWLLSGDLFQSSTRRTNVVSPLYRLRYAEFKPTKTLLNRGSSCPANSCSNTLSTVTNTVRAGNNMMLKTTTCNFMFCSATYILYRATSGGSGFQRKEVPLSGRYDVGIDERTTETSKGVS